MVDVRYAQFIDEHPDNPSELYVLLPRSHWTPLIVGDEVVGFAVSKEALEAWFKVHQEWRRGRRRHRLGKTCRVCGIEIDDRAEHCMEHNPRNTGGGTDDTASTE